MDWQMASPRPCPGTCECFTACWRKNGSKMRSRSLGEIPGPSSSTVNSSSSSVMRADTPIAVPDGVYLTAFWIRLASTRSIWLLSIGTDGRFAGRSSRSWRSPGIPRIRWSAPCTTAAGLVNAKLVAGARLPSGARAASNDSTSCASRSVSTSMSARNSLRVSSSQLTSVRRRLVTKPLM
jgi:hypothetical protein